MTHQHHSPIEKQSKHQHVQRTSLSWIYLRATGIYLRVIRASLMVKSRPLFLPSGDHEEYGPSRRTGLPSLPTYLAKGFPPHRGQCLPVPEKMKPDDLANAIYQIRWSFKQDLSNPIYRRRFIKHDLSNEMIPQTSFIKHHLQKTHIFSKTIYQCFFYLVQWLLKQGETTKYVHCGRARAAARGIALLIGTWNTYFFFQTSRE